MFDIIFKIRRFLPTNKICIFFLIHIFISEKKICNFTKWYDNTKDFQTLPNHFLITAQFYIICNITFNISIAMLKSESTTCVPQICNIGCSTAATYSEIVNLTRPKTIGDHYEQQWLVVVTKAKIKNRFGHFLDF